MSEPEAATRRLVAGPLSCHFDNGALRHVRWGEVEVIRGIAYLLRDRDWGTVAASVDALESSESADRFTLSFVLRMATPQGRLEARARIEGQADGRLSFTVSATPDTAIETNRCGFVVLHPAGVAGSAVTVEHTDGSIEQGRFPQQISPSQPMVDIRALSHAPAEGLQVECRLEAELPGDPSGKFEMEDQRNWSDASFKTYVASLLDPWPYVLPAHRALTQRVVLQLSGSRPERIGRPDANAAMLSLQAGPTPSIRLPQIGIGVPPGLHRATPFEHAALHDLGAAWWMLDATLGDPALPDDLAAAAELRQGLAARVQLDLVVPAAMPPDEAARQAALLCRQARLAPDAIRLLPEPYLKSYQPSGPWPDLPPLEAYAEAARRHFPGALTGGGMFTYFTELNRKRPPRDGLDFIGHATCPIVHAADDVSVMETLDALPAIVHSVQALWPGLPYRLGPSTLAAHRNPYGDAPAPNPKNRRIPLAAVDPRHGSPFEAAWTLGYAAAVAPAGLDVLALHHSHGSSGPCLGGQGATIPAWAVLRRLAAASGAWLVPISGLGDGLAGLAWSRDGGITIDGLIANLGPEELRVSWQDERFPSLRLRPCAVSTLQGATPC